MKKLKPAQYAKHASLTPARVSQLIKQGILERAIERNETGKVLINPLIADEIIADSIKRRTARAPKVQAKATRTKAADISAKVSAAKIDRLAESQARAEHYRSLKLQQEFEERMGKLVEASEVEAKAFEIGKQLRNQLQAMVERVTAELAPPLERPKFRERLLQEVNNALHAAKMATEPKAEKAVANG